MNIDESIGTMFFNKEINYLYALGHWGNYKKGNKKKVFFVCRRASKMQCLVGANCLIYCCHDCGETSYDPACAFWLLEKSELFALHFIV